MTPSHEPLTAEEVERLVAADAWDVLAYRWSLHILDHPEILTHFTEHEQAWLSTFLLMYVGQNHVIH